ncbi:hypothetical protein E2C01_037665 [Portunus trituberculatus]|uniref:Uncharacterized protein n=1 Tax=Portunus trituberculatus TaxID=210409 RepID=A0A5B7FF72_PORTR|nr:hypothetical protein [Portunus trituberculatus]
MPFDGDMDPNMGATINNIASTTHGWKFNSASNVFQVIYRRKRPGHGKKKTQTKLKPKHIRKC